MNTLTRDNKKSRLAQDFCPPATSHNNTTASSYSEFQASNLAAPFAMILEYFGPRAVTFYYELLGDVLAEQ